MHVDSFEAGSLRENQWTRQTRGVNRGEKFQGSPVLLTRRAGPQGERFSEHPVAGRGGNDFHKASAPNKRLQTNLLTAKTKQRNSDRLGSESIHRICLSRRFAVDRR